MSSEEGLLAEVLERPDDDAPRLVYADWLEDHGDSARAEFIRVQIERARGAAPRRRAGLERRERELLAEHELRWTAPLHGLVRRARFVRGFVERVSLVAEKFVRGGEELFRGAPVRHVILTSAGRQAEALARAPHLARVGTLEFRHPLGPDALRTLAGSKHLGNLTGLILRHGGVGDEGASVLGDCPRLARLTTLDLYAAGLTASGVGELARSPHLAGLSTLVLGCVEDGDGVVKALTGPKSTLGALAYLHLSFAGVGDAGAQRLAGSPRLAGLSALDLRANAIGPAGARALANSPHLRGLEALNLRDNPLGDSAKVLRRRFGEKVRI